MKKAYLIELSVMRSYIRQLIPIGLFVALCMGIGMGSIVSVAGAYLAMFGIMAAMSCSAYDDLNGWGAFRMAMPVGRREVVLARYLMVLTLMLLALVISSALCAVLWALGQLGVLPGFLAEMTSVNADDLVNAAFTAGICLAIGLVAPSISIPAFFKFGTTKATQYLPLIIVAVLSLGIYALGRIGAEFHSALAELVAWLSVPANTGIVVAAMVLVAAAVFAASAAISVRIYEHRDL